MIVRTMSFLLMRRRRVVRKNLVERASPSGHTAVTVYGGTTSSSSKSVKYFAGRRLPREEGEGFEIARLDRNNWTH
jgi:hypothetical protein